MDIIRRIRKEIQYFGVPKKQRLDYVLQKDISERTGFNVNHIDVLYVERLSNNEPYNSFGYCEFRYKGSTYKLIKDKLEKV
jgi:hypothetical protein